MNIKRRGLACGLLLPWLVKRNFAVLASALCLASSALAQVITKQPASQTVVHGGSVTFSVSLSGAGPFSYQWQCNGTNLPNGDIITTIAGDGANYSGVGPATKLGIGIPFGLKLDPTGNLFVADNSDNRVLVVWTNDVVQELAGSGPAPNNYGSYSGDGGPATNATLFKPQDVAINSKGQLIIADTLNQRLREVDTNGTITTLAQVSSPCAVTVDASDNILFAQANASTVCKMDTNGLITLIAGNGSFGYSGDGGPATNASLNFTYGAGIFLDNSANLYIADSYNFRIRKVDTQGIITTVAGSGAWGFSGDGGPATNAALSLPNAVAVDHKGNLYFADWGSNRIRRVDTNGVIVTAVGSGPVPDDGIYYAGDGGPATNAVLCHPQGVALDQVGNLYVSDSYNFRIRKVAYAGSPSITLSNVSPANAGQYQVIVSGAGGSVTSAVAVLNVSWPAMFSSAARNADGTVTLNCASAPGSTNILQATTNLFSPGSWQPVSTNLAGADGAWQFTDPSAPGCPVRFYRILSR